MSSVAELRTTSNTLFRPSVLLCPFSPLTEIILIAIAGTFRASCKTSEFWSSRGELDRFISHDRIVDAGLPHRSYVGVASGLLKDSNSACPIGSNQTRLGGSTCPVHEVGKGPRRLLHNCRDCHVSLCTFCVSPSAKIPTEDYSGRGIGIVICIHVISPFSALELDKGRLR